MPLQGLTALFGMGRGVSLALSHQLKKLKFNFSAENNLVGPTFKKVRQTRFDEQSEASKNEQPVMVMHKIPNEID